VLHLPLRRRKSSKTRLADEKNAYDIIQLASAKLHLSSFETHVVALSIGDRFN
jgi:hypothetical protein